MLSFQNVDYFIKDRQLLKNICFQVYKNQRIALIGRNGTGKSTIFKLIQNKMSDKGSIEIAKSCKVLAIQQEMPEPNMTPMDYLLSQDQTRYALFKELESCDNPNKMGAIYDKLIQADAYTAQARAAKILKGLSFNDNDQNKKMKSFSGGFRMRVALAAALFQEPDLLLLDEPTNHLDFETTQWLQGFLRKYPKSFILISHDKDFLNDTVNFIFHLKNSRITTYTGNYDTFIKTYNLQQENIASYNSKLNNHRSKMLEFVNKFGATASKAKQAQSRLKAIAKMEFIEVEKNDPNIKFYFPEAQNIAPPLIKYENIFLGYQDKVVLNNLSGILHPYDKIALLGSNGNGKTTFAKFIAGELAQLKGEIYRSPKLKIGYYKQDYLDSLDVAITAYQQLKSFIPDSNDLEIRSHLGRFGFSKIKAEQKVKELSGGEKARLLFSCLTSNNPNLLILDEPTNHLDIEMRESLIMAINAYNGAVILITHDRYLLEHVADNLWLVKDNNISNFRGDVAEYKKQL